MITNCVFIQQAMIADLRKSCRFRSARCIIMEIQQNIVITQISLDLREEISLQFALIRVHRLEPERIDL